MLFIKFMSFSFYKQFDIMDCRPTCVRIITKYYSKARTQQSLRDICQIQKGRGSLLRISKVAELIGFQSSG